MRILVVGNGGREHALLWALHRDAPRAELFATKPNPGMARLARGVPIGPMEIEALTGWAASQRIDLAVVGPEGPLAAGIVDRFRKKGVPVFGPTGDAARIESSKVFAKELMREAGVPTAEHRAFAVPEEATAYIRERGAPIVVKASGLAAGKGAVVCATVEDAVATVDAMLRDRTFGEAGREIVVEDFMAGEELSVFAVSDGRDAVLLVPAQDHKAVGEGDTGPNTGGMGAYAPVALATAPLLDQVKERIVSPTLAALAARECPFKGFLYAGLMLTSDGPKVVEFNCRMGDPEAQVVIPLLAEGSLLELMVEVAEGGSVAGRAPRSRPGAAVTTVLASEGYPSDYPTGRAITIPATVTDADDVLVFHAGTADAGGRLVTSGGRVLAATGLASTLADAATRSRAAAEAIEFEGKHYRRDIGWRELTRDERVEA
jgi:phosphoribosylamine--glycine ligase